MCAEKWMESRSANRVEVNYFTFKYFRQSSANLDPAFAKGILSGAGYRILMLRISFG
jgi:hypothetical protein